jgi:hypothetical protein
LPVLHGLELLKADSAEAAVGTWAAAWSTPGDAGKASQLLASLAQIAAAAGKCRGYDVLTVEPVGPHLRRVSVLLRYERQPIFAEFITYDRGITTPDWMVASVKWNTDPVQALPSSVWSRE